MINDYVSDLHTTATIIGFLYLGHSLVCVTSQARLLLSHIVGWALVRERHVITSHDGPMLNK
jgi:hypothetical protein